MANGRKGGDKHPHDAAYPLPAGQVAAPGATGAGNHVMVEAQEVEPDVALADVTDAGLVAMQMQPHPGQCRPGARMGREGSLLGRAHDNEVIGLCREPDYAEHELRA